MKKSEMKFLFLIPVLTTLCLISAAAELAPLRVKDGKVMAGDREIRLRGINWGWWHDSGTRYTEEEMKRQAEWGANVLRLTIRYTDVANADGSWNEERAAAVDEVVAWAGKHGQYVIIDMHEVPGGQTPTHYCVGGKNEFWKEAKFQEQFIELWKKLAERYRNTPAVGAYELMNEPVADDPEQWNAIVNECLAHIRRLEPRRTVVIGSNRWQNYSTVRELKIPDNDPNLMLSFHYYEPFILTHYTASWTDMVDYRGPVHYPGKLIADKDYALLDAEKKQKFAAWNRQSYNRDVIESQFRQAVEVAERYGLPLYCGEFGCIDQAPTEDKERWYADVVALFGKYGIARANWDYKGGFGIIVGGKVQKRLIKILTGKEQR